MANPHTVPNRRTPVRRSARPRLRACPLCLHEAGTLARTPILPALCLHHRTFLDCTLLGAILHIALDECCEEMEARQ